LLSQVGMLQRLVKDVLVEQPINAPGRTRPTASPRQAVAERVCKVDTVLFIDFIILSLPINH
jgi:hypothetical protein